jgi:hypothetical protein
VKVTFVPVQKILLLSELERVGTGRGLTVFVIEDDVAEHPFASVTMTETICPFTRELVV